MAEYVEKFIINKSTYGIEKAEGGRFNCWKSGCKIADRDSIEEARKTIHSYAISQSRAEIGSYQALVDAASDAIERLGSDPFHLGKFMA